MRFKGWRTVDRSKQLAEWHLRFAWFPVKIDHTWIWLETYYARRYFIEGDAWACDAYHWGYQLNNDYLHER